MKNSKPIKILDLVIEDVSLINVNFVARMCNMSQPYVHQLLNDKRKNKKAKTVVRNMLVKLYGSIIKFNSKAANIKTAA